MVLVPELDSSLNSVPIPVPRNQTQFQFGFLDDVTGSRTSNSNQPSQVSFPLQWFQLPSGGGYVAYVITWVPTFLSFSFNFWRWGLGGWGGGREG